MKTIWKLSIVFILFSCQVNNHIPNEKGTWTLSQYETETLNIHGIEEELAIGTSFIFEDSGFVRIKNPSEDTYSTVNYQIHQDTIIPRFVDFSRYYLDTLTIIYIGKEELKYGYIVEKMTVDTMILISKYKKPSMQLPEPNKFGQDMDTNWLKEYKIILTKMN